MGGIRPARSAGSTAAASVTSVPTASATTIALPVRTGLSIGMIRVVWRYHATNAANPNPTTTPSAAPARPMTSAWAKISPLTWRLVAPAARSRPTSRARSATVIDSVLKIRKAPPNSASAAIRAVVAWKSTVEARIEAARSAGPDTTYGSEVIRLSRSTVTASTVAPAPSRTSTRDTPSVPKRSCASCRTTITVRPSVVPGGPSPRRIPAIGSDFGPSAPSSAIVSPSRSPVSCAIRSVISAPMPSDPTNG